MLRHLNLLPPERRAHLRRGAFVLSGIRVARLFVVGLSLLSIGGVLLTVGMWLLTITFSGSENVELQIKVKEYVELRKEISEKNQLLRLVNDLGTDRVVWSDHLGELLKTIPTGTTIDSLTGDARVGIVNFSGTALARNSLVVFEQGLRQLSWVDSVVAPRRNFLKKDNPEYTFELRIGGFEEEFGVTAID